MAICQCQDITRGSGLPASGRKAIVVSVGVHEFLPSRSRVFGMGWIPAMQPAGIGLRQGREEVKMVCFVGCFLIVCLCYPVTEKWDVKTVA